jgi:hypothetical protein
VIVDRNGTNERVLASDIGRDDQFDWSPDETEIALVYETDSESGSDLYRYSIADRMGILLTSGAAHDDTPAWSPDGETIAFARRDISSGEQSLWVTDADGTNARMIVAPHGEDEDAFEPGYHPAWSPNGHQIADVAINPEALGGSFPPEVRQAIRRQFGTLFVVSPSGIGFHVLAEHIDMDTEPAWSPFPVGTTNTDATPTPEPTPTTNDAMATATAAPIPDMIAALPETQRGCAAMQVADPENAAGTEVTGTLLTGKGEFAALMASPIPTQLDDFSLPVSQSIVTYWYISANRAGGETLQLVAENLDDGTLVQPDLTPHAGESPWRPGDVWRTFFTFPTTGCWQIVATLGDQVGVLWVPVREVTESAESTEPTGAIMPNTLDQFRPLQPGEMRSFTLDIRADVRQDRSTLLHWNVKGTDQVLPDGTRQRYTIARYPDYETRDDGVFAEYGDTGETRWWESRGWLEFGSAATGIYEPPEELKIVERELAMLDTYVAQVEAVLDERGETTPGDQGVRFELDPAGFPRDFPFDIAGAYYEIAFTVADADSIELRGVRTVLVAADGTEYALADVTFLDVTIAPIAEDAAIEAPDELPEARALQYTPPADDALPGGLTVERHWAEFPYGMERMILSAEGGLQLSVMMRPSAGEYDPRYDEWLAANAAGSRVEIVETVVGPVTWRGSATEEFPKSVTWDDGRYRFEIGVTASSSPDDWTVETLVALVEALSATGTGFATTTDG